MEMLLALNTTRDTCTLSCAHGTNIITYDTYYGLAIIRYSSSHYSIILSHRPHLWRLANAEHSLMSSESFRFLPFIVLLEATRIFIVIRGVDFPTTDTRNEV